MEMEYHADRYAAYEIGLRAYKIEYNENFIVRSLMAGRESGYDAMKKLLALPEPPTAVFADTDLKAYGAIEAVKDAGLRVPEDISIAGFDDIPGSDTFEPQLTTVKIPYYEIGKKAVEMLLTRIKENSDIKTEVMRSSLVVRKSCSKVKGHL
jgi:LacI family transcriptional regulator